ncbi:DUF4349 domain-containing protein [Isosphaeraceae bacterium EP7]
MATQWARYLAACVVTILGGCSEVQYESSSAKIAFSPRSPAPVQAERAATPAADATTASPMTPGGEVPPAMPRKIIYNGYIDLVVDDLGGVESKLMALLKGRNGYVSETNVSGSPGSQRSGAWKVRVPAEHFTELMATIAGLGELRSTRTDSQDVSEEFYDIEARIAVKKQEEKRLLKILDEAAGKLKDILEVEKELSRVRSEIEQMEGRLRWLSHNSSLSTISLTVTEIKDYEPPVAPTYAQQVTRRFQASMTSVGEFLLQASLFVVGIVPWLVVIIPAGVLALLAFRRFRARVALRAPHPLQS